MESPKISRLALNTAFAITASACTSILCGSLTAVSSSYNLHSICSHVLSGARVGENSLCARHPKRHVQDLEAFALEGQSQMSQVQRPKPQSSAHDLLSRLMQAIRADPAPINNFAPNIDFGTPWLLSNEHLHHRWRDQVRDLGGIMVGIGAEQNYLIAGWARPEVLFLIDYDIQISLLHKAYRVAFELAATPDEFIMLWHNDEGRERLKTEIVNIYEHDEAPDISRVVDSSNYKNGWQQLKSGASPFSPVHGLGELQAEYASLRVPCFLTDQEHYDFIASLWKRNRVLAIRGDLTGECTLVDVAAFANAIACPVRVLYLSNAEDYIRCDAARFRNNIAGLPFDSRSLVLRSGGQDLRALFPLSSTHFITLLDVMLASGMVPYMMSVHALISACVKEGQWRQALAVLDEIRTAGLTPDLFSLVAAISS